MATINELKLQWERFAGTNTGRWTWDLAKLPNAAGIVLPGRGK